MQNSYALAVVTENPFKPDENRRYLPLTSPLSIAEVIERKRLHRNQAYIVMVGGKAILRAQWHKPLEQGVIINIIYLPAGGGGGSKKILSAVLSIALIAVAPMAAGAIAGSLGVTGAVGLGVIKAGVMMAGSALIQSVGPKPEAPSNSRRDIKAASPTYSLAAQGNTARIGEVIPVLYGKHIIFPAFAAMPYTHFDNSTHDQYLTQVFVIGRGQYQIEDIRIEDSDIHSFENEIGIAYFDESGNKSWGNYYKTSAQPNYDLIFKDGDDRVISASEVSGQALKASNEDGHDYVGPYVLNLADTLINRIDIDLMCPRGLYYAEDSGKLSKKKVEFLAEYQAINDKGQAYGIWKKYSFGHLQSHEAKSDFMYPTSTSYVDHTFYLEHTNTTEHEFSISNAQTNALTHWTVFKESPKDRVRVWGDMSVNDFNKPIVVTLRYKTASTTEEGSWEASTNQPQRLTFTQDVPAGRYQVRIKRTDKKDTSSRAGHDLAWAGLKGVLVKGNATWRDVTVLYTRLKATSGISQQTSRKVNVIATRVLTNPDGNTQPTQSIAWALYDVLKANYGAQLTDTAIDVDGLKKLHNEWENRKWTFNAVFDTQLSIWDALKKIAGAGLAVPVQQGNQIRFVMDKPQTLPSAGFRMDNIVKGSFSMQVIPASDATATDVQAVFRDELTWRESEWPFFDADKNPAKIEPFGVTQLEQVKTLISYTQKRNKLRRRVFNFETAMGGLIPSYGDLITITHDLPAKGRSVLIESVEKTQNGVWLTLSEDINPNEVFYIAIETRIGGITSPLNLREKNLNRVKVDALPDNVKIRDDGTTGASVGTLENYTQKALVRSVKPRANGNVQIEAFNYDIRIYEADETVLNDWYGELLYTFNPDLGYLLLSWQTLDDADYYQLEVGGYYTDNSGFKQYFQHLFSGNKNGTSHGLTLPNRPMWIEASVIARGAKLIGDRAQTKRLSTPTLRRTPASTDIVWEFWNVAPWIGKPFKFTTPNGVTTVSWRPATNAKRYVVNISGETEESLPPHYVPTRVYKNFYVNHITTETSVTIPVFSLYFIAVNVRAENDVDSETFTYSG